jgi:hypothetical protein
MNAEGLKPYYLPGDKLVLTLVPIAKRGTLREPAHIFWLTDAELTDLAPMISLLTELRKALNRQIALVEEMLPSTIIEKCKRHDTLHSQPAGPQ